MSNDKGLTFKQFSSDTKLKAHNLTYDYITTNGIEKTDDTLSNKSVIFE